MKRFFTEPRGVISVRMLNVAMLGASGRMGRTLVPLIVASGDLRLRRRAGRGR